jgi:cation diffusion facilitator CzcD-associated flavoprotein CzcO
LSNASTKTWQPRVAVIGAGFGGLTSGYLLKRAGITDFTIYERAADIGGTWYHNDYPGAEVDIHSHLYSFPFKTNLWTRTHAQQPELKRYIDEMLEEFDLRAHLRLNTSVDEAVWNASLQRYDLRLGDGSTAWANVVICAIGLFNNPRIPDWPGLSEFQGPHFHTTNWDHDLDITGKTVAVVGTGSTSTQVVATIAPTVKQLYVYQREAGWILPKPDRDFTAEEMQTFARQGDWRYRLIRWRLFYAMQSHMFVGRVHKHRSRRKQQMEKIARNYIDTVFADRPDLRDMVTPRYPMGGKRTVLNQFFYPALLRDNVQLIPYAVTSVTPTGVVSTDGVEREVDVLVMATGFQPANFISTVRVVGRTGRTIQEVWNGEPHAFVGVQTHEFPNFYMLYGPNTNGGEIFLNFKTQAGMAVKNMKLMMRRDLGTCEVKLRWENGYNRWLQRHFRNSVWTEANNYYKAPTGKIVTQLPFDAVTYSLLARSLRRPAQRTTRRLAGARHVDAAYTQSASFASDVASPAGED